MSETAPRVPARRRAEGNPFGIWEAAFGLVGGFLLEFVVLSAYVSLTGHDHSQLGEDVAAFVGLWVGFVGAAVLASRTGGLARTTLPDPAAPPRRPISGLRGVLGGLIEDYGLVFRWLDLPLGVVLGVGSQYLLVPLLEAPLQLFVHHLNSRLGQPARNILQPNGHSYSVASLTLLTVLVCIGSPLVEELFFRGLLLRGLLGRLAPLGRRLGPGLSIVITGLVFGLAHFEALQFAGLAGFGMLLAYVAYRLGRIGPTIVAHVAFNATTVIVFVFQH